MAGYYPPPPQISLFVGEPIGVHVFEGWSCQWWAYFIFHQSSWYSLPLPTFALLPQAILLLLPPMSKLLPLMVSVGSAYHKNAHMVLLSQYGHPEALPWFKWKVPTGNRANSYVHSRNFGNHPEIVVYVKICKSGQLPHVASWWIPVPRSSTIFRTKGLFILG